MPNGAAPIENTIESSAVPPDDAAHLLIVDDDKRIRVLLSSYLNRQGYRVTTASNADEASACMKNFSFDLIVLDVMMPGENGFEFAQRLRALPTERANVPILMLTARVETDDRVQGFEAGVDDYLGKPYEPRELSLRIASILRRAQPPSVQGHVTQVRFGGFTFDLQRGELWFQTEVGAKEVVRLTDREREMLRILAENAGQTVSRDVLAGQGPAGNERTIDVQVNRLRRKIERDPANPLHLQTARGAGYRLLVDH